LMQNSSTYFKSGHECRGYTQPASAVSQASSRIGKLSERGLSLLFMAGAFASFAALGGENKTVTIRGSKLK